MICCMKWLWTWRPDISDEVLEAIRIGRMVALQKPGGGVRGIVVERHSSAAGGENTGTRIERSHRSSNISFLVRVDHQKLMRVHRARSAGLVRRRSRGNSVVGRWHRRFRSDFSGCNADRIEGCSRMRQVPSLALQNFIIRAEIILPEILRGTTVTFAHKWEGTGRPPHACSHLVNIEPSLQRSPRCTRPPS